MKKILILIMLAMLVLAGCAKGNQNLGNNEGKEEIESGLNVGFESAPVSGWGFAYKSETNTFDIDNVTLTFYFGRFFNPSINHEREHALNIPRFDVGFSDSKGNPIYIVRQSTENFVSEEYRLKRIFDENGNVIRFECNHSEIITIPRELFSETQGVIQFGLWGMNIHAREPKYENFLDRSINYEIIGEQVILSPWE